MKEIQSKIKNFCKQHKLQQDTATFQQAHFQVLKEIADVYKTHLTVYN